MTEHAAGSDSRPIRQCVYKSSVPAVVHVPNVAVTKDQHVGAARLGRIEPRGGAGINDVRCLWVNDLDLRQRRNCRCKEKQWDTNRCKSQGCRLRGRSLALETV